MKKHINKCLSFDVRKRKDSICGIVLDYTNDWTLIRYNPVDFVIDGYMLINNRKIKGYRRGSKELLVEKVIQLKALKPPHQAMIVDLQTVLAAIDGLLQIELKAADTTYITRLNEIQEDSLTGLSIKTNGRTGKKMNILVEDIWTIQFDNDYTTSLELLNGLSSE
ncbi:hypothetical protein [Taibaiella chishuiensis]|nr:hypothetical protein [Taibaiella chishuiensis]